MSVGVFDAELNDTKEVANKSSIALIDTELSDTSENPVQNKVIATKFAEVNDKLSEKFLYDKNAGVLKIETNRTDEFYYDNTLGILHIK